jgi:hypothetical protein
MKLLFAALTLLLLDGVASQTCPSVDEYTEMSLADGALTVKYAIVGSSADERSILCVRLESDWGRLGSLSSTQVNGVTIIEIAMYSQEDGEYEISSSGKNPFLHALSSDTTLGYHDTGRGSFLLDFAVETTPPIPASAPDATPAAPLSGAVALTGAMKWSIAGSMAALFGM